jgi:hypothetical protein
MLDPQIALDPFEKQLDLPAFLVKFGNRQGGKFHVVGAKRAYEQNPQAVAKWMEKTFSKEAEELSVPPCPIVRKLNSSR